MLYKFAVCSVMIKLCIEMTSGFELPDSPLFKSQPHKSFLEFWFWKIFVLPVSLSLGYIIIGVNAVY